MQFLLRLLVVLLCHASIACGGGGGGGGGTTTPPPGEWSIGPLSPGVLGGSTTDLIPEFASTLSASVTGNPPSSIYLRVGDGDGLFTSARHELVGPTIRVKLLAVSQPAIGRYSKPVVVRICKDSGCLQEYPGSPQTVGKDVLVEGIVLSASALSFSAPVGRGAPSQDLGVTPPGGKDFDVLPLGDVQRVAPDGSVTSVLPQHVFAVTRSAAGYRVQAIGAAAGRYRWRMAIVSPGYVSQTVDLSYEVAGAPVQALEVLSAPLNLVASLASASDTFINVDLLQNMAIPQLNIAMTGSPDPMQQGWFRYWDTTFFTHAGGPADNGRRMRFVLNRCGYGAATSGCLGAGRYTATIDLTVVAFEETWRYSIPVVLTVE